MDVDLHDIDVVASLDSMKNPYMPKLPNAPVGWDIEATGGLIPSEITEGLSPAESYKLRTQIVKARSKWEARKWEIREREKNIIAGVRLYRLEKTNAGQSGRALESLVKDYENSLRQKYREQDQVKAERKEMRKAEKLEKWVAKKAAKDDSGAHSYINRILDFDPYVIDQLSFTRPEEEEGKKVNIPFITGREYLSVVQANPDHFGPLRAGTGPYSNWFENFVRMDDIPKDEDSF